MRRFNAIQFNINEFGKSAVVYFPNGYGASIVSNKMSYGGKIHLFEIAVLLSNGKITYETTIVNDIGLHGVACGGVIGWLSPTGVEYILEKISNLPSRYN